MAGAFKYRRQERTAEDMRRKASEGSRDYDNLFKGDVKLFKPKEGENVIRIMPPTWGFHPFSDAELDKMSEAELTTLQEQEDKYGAGWDLPIYVHYGVGPDNASYLCREKMLGERCPICEAKAATRDPDEADALSPTKRGLCYIIDRDAEKEGPQLWSMPFSKIRNEIYARSVDKKHGTPILVDDLAEGFDIIFNRVGKDDRTNYKAVEIDRQASPLHDDERTEDKWLDYTAEHPILEVLNFFDPEHIEKVLFGRKSAKRGERDEAEETEESTGRGGRRGGLRDRARRGRSEEASSDTPEERDYADAPAEEARRGGTERRRGAREEEEDPPREERTSRRGGRTPPPAEEPDEEVPEEGERDTGRRGGTSRRSARQEEPSDPEPEADTKEEAPSEQARSGLRSLRSRRGGR